MVTHLLWQVNRIGPGLPDLPRGLHPPPRFFPAPGAQRGHGAPSLTAQTRHLQQFANFGFRNHRLARRTYEEAVDGVAELLSLPVHSRSPSSRKRQYEQMVYDIREKRF
jgi:hypothetical protein